MFNCRQFAVLEFWCNFNLFIFRDKLSLPNVTLVKVWLEIAKHLINCYYQWKTNWDFWPVQGLWIGGGVWVSKDFFYSRYVSNWCKNIPNHDMIFLLCKHFHSDLKLQIIFFYVIFYSDKLRIMASIWLCLGGWVKISIGVLQ